MERGRELNSNRELTGERFHEFEKKIFEDATKGERFLNYFLDGLAIFFIALGVELVLNIFRESVDTYPYPDQRFTMLPDFLIGVLYTITYYTVLEATTGKSLGKFITKTNVVDAQGNKPSVETILIRSLCRNIPLNAFSFLGEDSRGWHDSISKTRVVKD